VNRQQFAEACRAVAIRLGKESHMGHDWGGRHFEYLDERLIIFCNKDHPLLTVIQTKNKKPIIRTINGKVGLAQQKHKYQKQ
jgi:hypothetical protein